MQQGAGCSRVRACVRDVMYEHMPDWFTWLACPFCSACTLLHVASTALYVMLLFEHIRICDCNSGWTFDSIVYPLRYNENMSSFHCCCVLRAMHTPEPAEWEMSTAVGKPPVERWRIVSARTRYTAYCNQYAPSLHKLRQHAPRL